MAVLLPARAGGRADGRKKSNMVFGALQGMMSHVSRYGSTRRRADELASEVVHTYIANMEYASWKQGQIDKLTRATASPSLAYLNTLSCERLSMGVGGSRAARF